MRFRAQRLLVVHSPLLASQSASTRTLSSRPTLRGEDEETENHQDWMKVEHKVWITVRHVRRPSEPATKVAHPHEDQEQYEEGQQLQEREREREKEGEREITHTIQQLKVSLRLTVTRSLVSTSSHGELLCCALSARGRRTYANTPTIF
jgi:hypothetical protein